MPELPDVEVFRTYFDTTSLDQNVQAVEVFDDRILASTAASDLDRVLTGHRFKRTTRHGKYMFAGTDADAWLVLHFGMTGYLRYLDGDAEMPAHTRALVSFDNDHRLAVVSQRLLGEMSLTSDPNDFASARQLGPDALQVDFDQFLSLFSNRRGTIKAGLTNQTILSGIGNIYADEILFQSRIHPKRRASGLSLDDYRQVYGQIHDVVQAAIAAQVDVDRMPDHFLLRHRQQGAECPRCGTPVETTKVSGRTTYFCPNCQREG